MHRSYSSRRNFEADINMKNRCITLGEFIIAHNSTVRETASVFGISKSTVHTEVTKCTVL